MAKILVAETSITIQAPIERVWQIMLDVEKYNEWNSFIVHVIAKGETDKVGTRMGFTVQWHDGGKATSSEVVKKVLPPHDVNGTKHAYWSYVFDSVLDRLGLVHAVRHQWLEEHAEGKTTYRTQEIFTGLFIGFLPLRNVQDGFERQAAALKHRAENRTNN